MTDEPDAPGEPSKQRGSSRQRGSNRRRHNPGFITRAARDTLHVSRAFGTAYERDGVRIIPVARVMGVTGSGYGGASLAADADVSGNGDGYGGGGGFGTIVKPLGVVVIDDSGVHWQPTIDVNRAILGGQIVLALAVLTTGCVLGRRRKTVHRLHLPSVAGLLRHRVDRA
ncbi:Sporulation protein YtfJ (Spore_YtfJ) [Sanguibacter gelidistatuariae]|uniref:Sporulation protein YtfJ (Spore_YtfJ) n=1 Tax=Sanguibacter gelidistatuariae TaxID=1814289 RepID=A0A1G6P2C8_9MICO|nr:spore germination protein GerW family protein [Sanguibacter gelidistatuariae]SDC73646.1 Sporulation protein YtfJ (Spore_YtfJ) [Sanguibacter gelidistatuariae]